MKHPMQEASQIEHNAARTSCTRSHQHPSALLDVPVQSCERVSGDAEELRKAKGGRRVYEEGEA